MPPETAPAPAPAPSHYPKPLPFIIALVVLLAAGGALWYVLTRPVEGLPPQGMATTTPSGSETGELVLIRDSSQYYEIQAAYPSSTSLRTTAGASADAKAVSLMKTFAEQEVARFRENNVDTLTAEDIQVQGLGGDRIYSLEAQPVYFESDVTISYVYSMYVNTMGAHPNTYYRTFTFDKETGEGLHLDDIFSETADYTSVLSMETRTRLKAALGADASIDMLEAGTSADADNFQNFYLEGDVLVMVFPPYQVGPYAIGTQEVRIPRASLGNALKAKYR